MGTVRLATFNVLFGGQERMDALVDVVRQMAPDVLVLQECIGWQKGDRLAQIAAAMGVVPGPATTHLGLANPRPSGRQFNVALVSKLPITQPQTYCAGYTHCVIEADVHGFGAPLTIIGAHLVSRDEAERLLEVDRLVQRYDAPTLAAGRFVLLGDLNALSRHDPYDDALDATLQACGIHKYGHPPRFAELDRLHAAGWVDAVHADPSCEDWVTARRGGNGHRVDTRTDYVLLSPPLVPLVEKCEIIEVGDASDHNAVVVTLRVAD